jgi:hypothetical protein
MRAACAAHAAAVANTLHGMVGKFRAARWAGDLDDFRRLAPYAVLFLQWEAQFPEQWRSAGPWSPWGLTSTKVKPPIPAGQKQIRNMSAHRPPSFPASHTD